MPDTLPPTKLKGTGVNSKKFNLHAEIQPAQGGTTRNSKHRFVGGLCLFRMMLVGFTGALVGNQGYSNLKFFEDEIGVLPVVWFDAADATETDWPDRSGNERHALRVSGTPNPVASGLNGKPIVELRRANGDDEYIIKGDPFIAKEHFYVFRSPNDKFNNHAGILGHPNGRGSNYLFENNNTYFHSNQRPSSVSKNGVDLANPYDLAPITDFMIMQLVVNNNNLGPHTGYKIGEVDKQYSADLDIAEIIAFDTTLSTDQRQRVEGYLASKWGLQSLLATDHPYNTDWPEITLLGDELIRVTKGATFTDPGATATDTEDGVINDINVVYAPQFPVPGDPDGDVETVQGITVKSSTPHYQTRVAENAINGSGLSNGEHDSGSDTLWMTDTGNPTGEIIFDLGASYDLASLHIWNHNQSGFTDRGASFVELFVDDDPEGASFTSVAVLTLDEATGTADYAGQAFDLVEEVENMRNTRLVKLEIQTNYGDTEYTGLSEIQFHALKSKTFDELDTSLVGDWSITYTAVDSNGQTDSVERKLRVFDPDGPVITLDDGLAVHHEQGTVFNPLGYTVKDKDGTPIDTTNNPAEVSGNVNPDVPGDYLLTYNFTDDQGRKAELVEQVVSVSDTVAPQIQIIGGETISIPFGQKFMDPGAMGEDFVDGVMLATSSNFVPNRILHRGFHGTMVDEVIDFSKPGSLLEDLPLGETYLAGPLSFNGDQSFLDAGVGITSGDRFRCLFLTHFTALVEGEYEFGTEQADDRVTFWMDLNQNGRFESEKGEWLNQGYRQGYSTVQLTPGYYKVAIGFLENTGGSLMDARFRTPTGAGPDFLSTINPTQASQAGLWSEFEEIDPFVEGTYTITYTATDQAGNISTATRTVEISKAVAPPVIALQGRPIINHPFGTEFIDPGIVLTGSAGEDLTGEIPNVKITGLVDSDKVGEYLILYEYSDSNNVPAVQQKRIVNIVDKEAPTVELVGDATIEYTIGEVFVDPGVTVTDNYDTNLSFGTTSQLPTQNLWLHVDASQIAGIEPGGVIPQWYNLVTNGNDLSDVRGEPTWHPDALNGMPVVRVDGDDLLAIEVDIQQIYSIFTVSQLDTNLNGRLFSSLNSNWLLGYENGQQDVFHNEMWVNGPDNTPVDPLPNLYSATSDGAYSRFWANGEEKTYVGKVRGRIAKFQIGGYQISGSNPASGDVAEVLIYNNHVVSEAERLSVEAYLGTKYKLPGYPDHTPPDLTKPGDYQILYVAQDSSGNVTFATRDLKVNPNPALPVIVLEGDSEITHDAGTDFSDPGHKITNSSGEEIPNEVATITGTVDKDVPGLYELRYTYDDGQGNVAEEVVRTVLVADITPPEITLIGGSEVRLQVGEEYIEPGATATDTFDTEVFVDMTHDHPVWGWIPGLLGGTLGGNDRNTPNPGDLGVDPFGPSEANNNKNTPGSIWGDNMTVVYTGQVFDEDGIVSFLGNTDDNFYLYINGTQVVSGGQQGNSRSVQLDLGAGDNGWHDFELRMAQGGGGAGRPGNYNIGFGIDKSGAAPSHLTSQPDESLYEIAENTNYQTMDLFRVMGWMYNKFDTSTPGTYKITYTSTDAAGNIDTVTRKLIIVEDTGTPFIVLNGESHEVIEAGSISEYVDPGAVVKDANGVDILEANLLGVGDVDTAVPASYEIRYFYDEIPYVTRVIEVVDSKEPVITLAGEDPFVIYIGDDFVEPGASAIDSLDGSVNVVSELDPLPNHLGYDVHLEAFDDGNLDFTGNGGVLAMVPAGATVFRSQEDGTGLEFISDTQMRDSHPNLTRTDNFQLVFHGFFNARQDGEYEFEGSNVDDRITIWLDKDQDGIFERLGDAGDERLTWQNQASELFLSKGLYRVVIAHAEGGGGARFTAKFRTPAGAGPEVLTVINPSDPLQSDIWYAPPNTLDTSVPGFHKIVYLAEDKAGNVTTAIRNVLVMKNPNQPVLTMLGEDQILHIAGVDFVDPGVLLDDAQGNPLDESQVLITGIPSGRKVGEFTIEYRFTDQDGNSAEPRFRQVSVQDIVPPEILLNGSSTVSVQIGQPFQDPGITVTDSFDSNVKHFSSMELIRDGLVLHLDAGSFQGVLQDGEKITTQWDDLSGHGNHADQFRNNVQDNQYPTWVEVGTHGQPAVNFNGDSVIYTSKNFEQDLAYYTIFSISRYTGGPKSDRIISSRGRNWLFGYNDNGIRRFHSDGWAYNQGPSDTEWHMHAGTANPYDSASFWMDNILLGVNLNGLSNTNYKPRNINLGGYNDTNDLSNCEVSEVLLYDRELTLPEIEAIQSHLSQKYSIPGAGSFAFGEVDTTVIGEQTITYVAFDQAGNSTTASRAVMIVDTPLPVIQLTGDALVTIPTGQTYLDAGAIVTDSDGDPLPGTPTFTTNLNTDLPGIYTYTYDFTDGQGNQAPSAVRVIKVVDQTPPVITLVDGSVVSLQTGNAFIDPGFSAHDIVDGEVQVTVSTLIPNRILSRGFSGGGTDANLDFANDGGLLSMNPEYERWFNGPYGDEVFVNNQAELETLFDDFSQYNVQVLLSGHFYTSSGGTYEFGVEQADDRVVFWFDIDGDGNFEASTPEGGEMLNDQYQFGYRTLDLRAGKYRYAIGFRQGGGGARFDARYRAIRGVGPSTLTRIKPSDPAQQGQWIQYNPVNIRIPGEHEVTYTATDKAGNTTTVVRKVIVGSHPDAAVIELVGDSEINHPVGQAFSDPGSNLKDQLGGSISGDVVVSGGVNTEVLGTYILEYNYESAEGVAARTVRRTVKVVDTVGPVISLVGGDMTHVIGTPFVDPGATAADNYYGTLPVGSTEAKMPHGLVLHLDASSIFSVSDGERISNWPDLSGNENHANQVFGNPIYVADAINGLPAVRFDGLSRMHTLRQLDIDYSILSVSRLTGSSNQRLLSSMEENWFIGYDSGNEGAMFVQNGWITAPGTPATLEPRLFSATAANREIHFYADGIERTIFSKRRDNNYRIGTFQMGAYQLNQYAAAGDVAEVLIFDRALTRSELLGLEAFLNTKYSLNGLSSGNFPVNVNELGEYEIVYHSIDASGNSGKAVRKVTVVPDPDAPVITLLGDLELHHEAGEVFNDPGVELKDSTGGVLDFNLVTVTSDFDPNIPGEYVLRYNYEDNFGKVAPQKTRIIIVTDTLKPVITLQGDEVVKLKVGDSWTDPGATAVDQANGPLIVINDLEYNVGQLDRTGFTNLNDHVYLDLDQNGGLLAETPKGTGILTNGPNDGGLNYSNVNDFFTGMEKSPGIPMDVQNDNFQMLYTGVFMAPVDGDYEFGYIRREHQTSLWLDLNQNGVFELVEGEQLKAYNEVGWATVTLSAGYYEFAAAYRENNGGEYFQVGYSLPKLGNGQFHRQTIMPVAESQLGYWSTLNENGLDTSVAGIRTITYLARDISGHVATATRTIIVVEDDTLPFIALKGGQKVEHEAGTPWTDPGATVTDQGGGVLQSNLQGQGTFDPNQPGVYTLTYDYTDSNSGKSAETITRTVTVVDTTPPQITINEHPVFGGTDVVTVTAGREWIDPGVETTDIDPEVMIISSCDYIPHRLRQYGYMLEPENYLLQFEDPNSLLTQEPVGMAWFTEGPRQIGYEYNTDNEFRSIPNGITRDDNFQVMTTGVFHAKATGQYQFRTEHTDRWVVLWMDLDQDGIYSRNGAQGDERLCYNYATGTRTLSPGFYKFAVANVHATGGARVRAMVKTPGGAGPSDALTIINPVALEQNGLWFAEGSGPIDTMVLGEHEITYYALDAWGNISTKPRTVVVVPDPDAPVLELVGDPEVIHEQGTTYTDPGVTAKSAAGDTLDASTVRTQVTRRGILQGVVDGNVPGEYSIRYDFTDSEGRSAIPLTRTVIVADTTPPVITISGQNPASVAPGFAYIDAGAIAVDAVDGDVSLTLVSSSPLEGYVPGLLMGTAQGNLNGGANPGNHGVDPLGPTHASTRDQLPWRGDYTIFYTGEIYDADGIFSFREAIGDKARIVVDLNTIIDSNTEADFLEASVNLGRGGWFSFELRMSGNESVPFGAMDQLGIGFDPEGRKDYVIPKNSSSTNANLFRVLGTDHSKVDTSMEGTHTITYTAMDSSGNTSTLVRTIIVKDDPLIPVLAYDGPNPFLLDVGTAFATPDVRLEDSRGDLIAGAQIDQSGTLDTDIPGTYILNFDSSHGGKTASTLSITVNVVDRTPPALTLIGANPVKILQGETYLDAGALVEDNVPDQVSLFSNLEMIQKGLLLHLDASTLAATHNDGETVNVWPDSSPNGYDTDNKRGDPSFVLNATHGQPAVNFDGDDGLWIDSKRFDGDTLRYTIFSVARYTDDTNQERIISGYGRNWAFGFYSGSIQSFHSDGWLINKPGADKDWHVHTGLVKDGPLGSMWMDGEPVVIDGPGLHPTNYRPVNIQLGGYNRGSEMSKAEVSELLLFGRNLSETELAYVTDYLNSKYSLNGGGTLQVGPIDTSTLGEKSVRYYAVDSSGNSSTLERQVIVVDQLELPVITLNGDPVVTHGSDQPYTDAGVIIKDAQGATINEDPVVTSTVNHELPGEYQVYFDYTDGDGNAALTVSRTVIIEDRSPPVINLVGGDTYVHQLGNPFIDPGFSAHDLAEGVVKVDSSVITYDSIRAQHFIGQNRNRLDLTNGGGLLLFTPDNIYENFTTGIRNQGLYIDGNDWATMYPDWASHDDFMMLFDGYFHTASGGIYEFGIEWPDDVGSFYLDLDQDGIFEMDGDYGPEQMNSGIVYGYREVALKPGFYKYAVALLEGASNARIDARYRAIEGDGPLARTRIFPTEFSQRGQWVQYLPINTLGAGEYEITYTASDSLGNTSTATRTVIVKNQPESAIIELNGGEEITINHGETYTDAGANLIDLDGDAVPGTVEVQGMVDTMKPGEYKLIYTFTNDQGFTSRQKVRTVHVVDQTPPQITLGGGTEIRHFVGSTFLDPGASANDSVDGSVVVGSTEMLPDNGLILHLDASSLLGVEDGDSVTLWNDLSPEENHATDSGGTPIFREDAINGQPAIYFDGFSWMGVASPIGNRYTILTVSRMEGSSSQRLLTSADQNWTLGYSNGYEDYFRANDGEASFLINEATTDVHLYTASAENMMVQFYSDGIEITEFSQRRNTNYEIGVFQMGAYLQGQETSKGFVSEVIVYDRVLAPHERKGVEARLNAKYGLNGFPDAATPVNPEKPGEYDIVYEAVDTSGNRSFAVRKVIVEPNPNAPVITLNGDEFILHEAGSPFVDPGVVLKDAQGGNMDENLVVVSGDFNAQLSGLYTIRYNYIPLTGLPATEVTRTVRVKDTQPPVITLAGDSSIRLKVGDPFVEPGFSATDDASGDVLVVDSLNWNVNQLLKQGFEEPHDNQYTAIDLDNNGGLLAGKVLGSAPFSDGPVGTGLIYGANTQFFLNLVDEFGVDIPDLTDKYQIMWSGSFVAPVPGVYEFGVEYQDDRCAVFVDINQNGIFENAFGEQIVASNQTGFMPVELSAGIYKFAVTFAEGGGGERTKVLFSVPGSNGFSRKVIHPTDPIQDALWVYPNTEPLDTSVPGEYTIRYISRDHSGNLAIAERHIHVVVDDSLPFIALNGGTEIEWEAGTPFVDPGAKVTSGTGSVLETDFKGVHNVDHTVLGEYTVTYDYNDAGKDAAQVTRKVTVVDTIPPEVTLNGDATITLTAGSEFVDPGVAVTDADSSPLVVTGYIPNKLNLYGYLIDGSPARLVNFDLNGGLLMETPKGSDYFTKGPFGKGYDYANDGDFSWHPIGINRIDYYQTLVTGYFHAKVDGDYTFRTDNVDNYLTFWMDLNQDGVFLRGTAQEDELITNQQANGTRFLNAGFYPIALGYMETTGGARGRMQFQTPPDAGPSDQLTVLKPSDPAQAGLWFIKGEDPVNTTFTGTYVVNYQVIDHAGLVSTVSRTVIVEPDPDAPVLTLVGDSEIAHEVGSAYVDQLPTVTTTDDPAKAPEVTVTIGGLVVSEVDGTQAGVYEIVYEYEDDAGRKAIPLSRTVTVADTVAPVITLNGDQVVNALLDSEYKDAGATATDALDGDVTVVMTSSKPVYGYLPGLLGGTSNQWSTTSDNPANMGVDPLGPSAAQINTDLFPWTTNTMVIYTGEIYDEDGIIAFREDIDDWARVEIDGQELFDDHNGGSQAEKSIDLGKAGWLSFDLRMWNGGGPGGARSYGIDFDPNGGTNWSPPMNTNLEDPDLFRAWGPMHETIDTKFEGEYTITFTATDAAGNTSEVVRTVIVKDDLTMPVITLIDGKGLIHEAGTPFVDPGATVGSGRGDVYDASKVVVTGSVDVNKVDLYELSYTFSDNGKSAPPVTRKVEVVDTTPPTITLEGGAGVRVSVGGTYVDPGYSITDNLDTGLTANVQFLADGAQPILHWEFNNTEGDVLTELMNNVDGTLKNFPDPDAAWLPGKYGNALHFDSINGSYVEIPGTPLLDLQGFTISVWVNSTDYERNMFVFEKSKGNLINSQYNVYFDSDGTFNFKTFADLGGEHKLQFTSSDFMTVAQWEHLAITYDGQNKLLYVNGELTATETHDGPLHVDPNSPSYIGAFAPGDGYFFDGAIDDLKIYDEPLPESMIDEISKRAGVDTSLVRKENPFKFLYTVTDANGNTASVERTIVVSNDTTPPTLVLNGAEEIQLAVNDPFNDPGVTANDNQDGAEVAALVVVTGEVDTTKSGVYHLTYDVMDLSFNSAPSVTRTVIVGSVVVDPLDAWVAEKLPTHSADDKLPNADPDLDQLENLLEYALGGDPAQADSDLQLPTVHTDNGSLKIIFVRLKASVDPDITYRVELTTNLNNPNWSDSAVTISTSANQDNLPIPTENYERVEATANTPMASEPAGMQFMRLVVERP